MVHTSRGGASTMCFCTNTRMNYSPLDDSSSAISQRVSFVHSFRYFASFCEDVTSHPAGRPTLISPFSSVSTVSKPTEVNSSAVGTNWRSMELASVFAGTPSDEAAPRTLHVADNSPLVLVPVGTNREMRQPTLPSSVGFSTVSRTVKSPSTSIS